MALQHVVLFRFPQPLPDAEAATLREMVASWPARIGGFRRLRFGTDLNAGARSRGFSHLLFSEHDDEDALRRYQGNPTHLAFADWVYARGGEVLAFDYHIDSDTVLIDE